MSGSTGCYYSLLGVKPGASDVELREAYMRLKNAFSGKNQAAYSLFENGEEDGKWHQIETAFKVLDDPLTRKEYDLESSLISYGSDENAGSPQGTVAEMAYSGLEEFLRPSSQGGGFDGPAQIVKVASVKQEAEMASQQEIKEKMDTILNESDAGDGAILRSLRQLVQVEPEEIQERTKISRDYIVAMEENRYDRLPQSVYVRGFLRSYLKYIGLRGCEKIVSAYSKRLENWSQEQI